MNLAPHPFTLRQLQYVVAVAERRSFRQAAEACRVAQPSLSAQVAQVEDLLSVKLFERDRRRVVPTAAGLAFVARARAILLEADGLVDAARVLGDPLAGPLRLGVIPTVAPYLLPEVAPALRTRFPKLTFLWTEDKTASLVERLGRAELDGALVALEADLGDLPRVVLGKDPFVFAAPPGHPLSASRRPLDPPISTASTCSSSTTATVSATRRWRSARAPAPTRPATAPPASRRSCRWRRAARA
jgi:LysR family transcriptional regulator, hydrogen peroxide-inducible genes activator